MVRVTRIVTFSLLFLFATVLMGASFFKLRWGLYNALDLAIFNQVFWQTTHGTFFGMTIHPHSYLGDHFNLFILLLAPFYAVVPRPETLLTLQAIALSSAPVPLILLRTEDIRRSKTAAVLVILGVLLWIVNPYVHNAHFFEFHTIVFAAPLLTWGYWAYRKERLKLFRLFLVLLLTLREDVAPTVFAFAFLAFAERRSLRWWLPQAGLSLVWFFGATTVSSMLNTSGQYKFTALYSWMGEGMVEMVRFVLTKPVEVARHLFSNDAVKTFLLAVSSFLFLPVMAPSVLILAVPSLLIMGLSNRGLEMSFLTTHYQVIALTALLIAFFDAVPVLVRLLKRAGVHRRMLTSFLGGITVLLLVTVGINVGARSPFFVQAKEHPMFRLPARSPEVRRAFLERLSGLERVMAGSGFLTDLPDREMLMAFHYAYIGRKQFSEEPFPLPSIDAALFDGDEIIRLIAAKDNFPWAREGIHDGSERLRAYLEREELRPALTYDDTILFTKTGLLEPFVAAPANVPIEELAFGRADLMPCDETLCLSAETLHPQASEDVLLRLAFFDEDDKEVWQSFYLPAYGLLMPHAFEEPQSLTTRFRLALPPLQDGRYEARLSLEPIDGEHAISLMRHAAFVPRKDNPKRAEETLGLVIFTDGYATLSEDARDREENANSFE